MWKFYLCSSELSQNIICKEHQAPKIDHLKVCGGNVVSLIGSLGVVAMQLALLVHWLLFRICDFSPNTFDLMCIEWEPIISKSAFEFSPYYFLVKKGLYLKIK